MVDVNGEGRIEVPLTATIQQSLTNGNRIVKVDISAASGGSALLAVRLPPPMWTTAAEAS